MHVDVGIRMGTNAFKFESIDGVKYPNRIWNDVCWHNRHALFINSDVHATFKEVHPRSSMCENFFKENAHPCMKGPMAHS